MRTILDASTLINISNGKVLDLILALPGRTFIVSTEVRKESRTIAEIVDALVTLGLVEIIDDSVISAAAVAQARTAWQLGSGECECILAAAALGISSVACDDLKARRRIESELGTESLTGSLGLLKDLVNAGLLDSDEAYSAYLLMRAAGGFLPSVHQGYFDSTAELDRL